MKKIIFFLILGISHINLSAQDECGGAPTGMNLVVYSTSCIKGMFFRPSLPEKFWNDPKVREYEKNFLIKYKPYFSQGNQDVFYKTVDTVPTYIDRQVVGTEHEASFEFKSLLPGVSYEFCIYTMCKGEKIGPLCYFATTTLEAPYILKFDSLSQTSGRYKFEYKPDTYVIPNDIILEYREKSEDWKIKHVNFGSVYFEDLKPNHTYFARYKVVYDHGVESEYSNILIVSF